MFPVKPQRHKRPPLIHLLLHLPIPPQRLAPFCPPPTTYHQRDQPVASSTTMVTLRSERQGSRAVAGGRDAGKSMPPETPDLASLEFCKFMSYGLSWEKLVLPDKFGCTLMGRGLREVKLRVAGGGERGAWDVEVTPDEYGDVYLAGGWREFARANGLDLGQLLAFRYDGVALITITVLEGRPYQHEEEEEDAEGNSSPPGAAQTGSGSSRGGAGRAEAGSDDPAASQFSVTLRKCHFGKRKHQYLCSTCRRRSRTRRGTRRGPRRWCSRCAGSPGP
uniref:Uncharacterized protein n=1 Tax=Avena sativa TaxID=4498 RepID=A0ACD5WKZ5_AVESA